MSAKVFSNRVKRLEDPALLTGTARFLDDIELPAMLEACFLRSPFAHAMVRGIDKTAACVVDGVHAVYVMADLRPHLTSDRVPVAFPAGVPNAETEGPVVLVADETCFAGEAVAIVLAESRHIAEDAAALIEVDYDPLPAVGDCKAAMEPGAPSHRSDMDGNVLTEILQDYGDVDAAFADASHVFHEHIWQHRGGAHPMECRGVVANYDSLEDRTTVWSSTQMANLVHGSLVKLLGCDENGVRVITPDVGGGFGPKFMFYPEEVVVTVAAKLAGRPVKWTEDRREHFIATIQERDQYWDVEIACDGEGTIKGLRGTLIHDHGAYTSQGVTLAFNASTAVPGPYKVPNYRLNAILVHTNKVPTSPVRGASHPQATFTMERMMDRVAAELDIDRAELRLRNMITAAEMPYKKPMKTRAGVHITYDSGDYPKCQAQALEAADYAGFSARQAEAREAGRFLGFGISNGVKGTGRGPFEQATVRIGTSGKISVYTGAAPMGQSTRTMLAQIVAEQLGGDMGNIIVTAGDTASTAIGIGGFGSRQTVTAGSSAHIAAIEVRDKALSIAAHMLEAAAEDLEIEGGEIRVKGVPDMSVGLGQVANAVAGTPGYALPGGISPGLEATSNFLTDALAYCNGSHACEVAVDPETGAVKLINYVIVHDSGRLINPTIVEGQVQGGAVHGIGNAIFEWMAYDETGQPLTTTLAEYLLPLAPEIPNMEIILNETPSPLNPLGVKGAGEGSTVPAAAAVISAIENALQPFGVHIAEAPISPTRLFALINGDGGTG